MSEKQIAPLKVGKYDDEIDLVELLRELWVRKLLIVLVALCGFFTAVVYVYFTPKKFESSPDFS